MWFIYYLRPLLLQLELVSVLVYRLSPRRVIGPFLVMWWWRILLCCLLFGLWSGCGRFSWGGCRVCLVLWRGFLLRSRGLLRSFQVCWRGPRLAAGFRL